MLIAVRLLLSKGAARYQDFFIHSKIAGCRPPQGAEEGDRDRSPHEGVAPALFGIRIPLQCWRGTDAAPLWGAVRHFNMGQQR